MESCKSLSQVTSRKLNTLLDTPLIFSSQGEKITGLEMESQNPEGTVLIAQIKFRGGGGGREKAVWE